MKDFQKNTINILKQNQQKIKWKNKVKNEIKTNKTSKNKKNKIKIQK